MKEYRYETRNLSLVGFFNDVTAVVPEQTGTKPPRREIRAGPNKRCNTIYVSAMLVTHLRYSSLMLSDGLAIGRRLNGLAI